MSQLPVLPGKEIIRLLKSIPPLYFTPGWIDGKRTEGFIEIGRVRIHDILRHSQIRPAFRLPAGCGAGYNERQKKPFAGILTPEEADSMERAIEEGCERVSP
ncbi:MAG: hypothetical protein HPY58_07635 [Firmicutes bacterium]|nr:hypothetical protein [Bacillota bacterium]